MNVIRIIDQCQNSGISLKLDGKGNILCRGNRNVIGQLVPKIRQHKLKIIKELSRQIGSKRKQQAIEIITVWRWKLETGRAGIFRCPSRSYDEAKKYALSGDYIPRFRNLNLFRR